MSEQRFQRGRRQTVLVTQRRQVAIGQQSTLIDDEDAVADGLHIGDDVGGEQDGTIRTQPPEQLTEGHHLQWIEAMGGFVQQQHGRVVDQGRGQSHALAIAG